LRPAAGFRVFRPDFAVPDFAFPPDFAFAPDFAVPPDFVFPADFAVPAGRAERAGTRVAARTSASRADRARRRRHVVVPKMIPSNTAKIATAIPASVIRLWPRFLLTTVLCTAGAAGAFAPAPDPAEAAVEGTASASRDAAVRAAAASTVP
jgi:hypothetical protein